MDSVRLRADVVKCLLAAVLLATMAGIKVASAGEMVSVALIDGTRVTGELKTWSTDRITLKNASEQVLMHDNIRSFSFERTTKRLAAGSPMILLTNGDAISARVEKIQEDILTASWTLIGPSPLKPVPLERIVAVVMDFPATVEDRLRFYADLETLPAGSDLVMLQNGDRTYGEFQQLDGSFLELKGSTGLLKLDRSRVRALRFNPDLTNDQRTKGKRFIIRMTDGSQITAIAVEFADTDLKIESRLLGELVVPVDRISTVDVFTDRLVPVSDYEPENVQFTAFLSKQWPLVRNRNVLHGPLSLRGVEYVIGLGMHSQMSVTYVLRGNESQFLGEVGIDDIANGLGSVNFVVEIDGKRVWSGENVGGKIPAIRLPAISLKGHKRLTLIVEYGEFADVADYANWCDAMFVIDPKP